MGSAGAVLPCSAAAAASAWAPADSPAGLAAPRSRTRQPGQDGSGGDHGPETEPGLPLAAERAGQRDGGGGREGRAEGEGHRVQAGHGGDPVREPALHDDRHQDVADRDAHQGEGAGGEEAGRAAREGADGEAERDRGHTGADHGGRAEAAGELRSHHAEHGEAQRRHGGQHAGDAAAHAEAVPHLFEEGAEAGDRGAQVERREDQADGDQPQGPRARGGRFGRGARVRRTRWGLGRRLGFLTWHESHHRMMG